MKGHYSQLHNFLRVLSASQAVLKSVMDVGAFLERSVDLSSYVGLALGYTYSYVFSRLLCTFWILSEEGANAMTPSLNYPKLLKVSRFPLHLVFS